MKHKILLVSLLVVTFSFLVEHLFAYGTLANTPVVNGGDAGTVNVIDVDGDTIITWDGGITKSSETCAQVTIYVDTGTAALWVSTPTPNWKNIAPGTTAYFFYQVRNRGNANDQFGIIVTSVVSNCSYISSWVWKAHRDDLPYGQFNNEPVITQSGVLAAEATYYFIAAVYMPPQTVNGSSTTFRVQVKANFGTGTEDNWPNNEAGNDDISHYVMVKYEEAKLLLTKSTHTVDGRERPGDVYEYRLVVKSTGVVKPTPGSVVLRDKLPTYVDIVQNWSGINDVVAVSGTTTYEYNFDDNNKAIYDSVNRIVIIKLDDFELNPGDEVTVRFRVRVK
ncbi:MAG: hypothetical protein RMJ13_00420 [Elusimicrobiota bacterium]|nr:hypothetical protein [Elusimicrobiota bacterium]